MSAVDVRCPACGTVNKSVDLEETDGWMECESCGEVTQQMNTYKRHVQSLSIDEDSGNPEDLHPLFKKFGDVLSVELKVTFRDKYAWLDEISSPELTKKLLSLTPEDLELLDAYVFGEKTQVELAKKNGISQKNISKKLNRIRRFLAGD